MVIAVDRKFPAGPSAWSNPQVDRARDRSFSGS